MATVVGDSTGVSLEFTSFELDLMREIAFNTGKSVEVVAAERMSHGIVCGVAGEQDEPENTHQTEPPRIDLEELGITAREDAFRDRMYEILNELYNVAWSRGTYANSDMDKEARRIFVAKKVDEVMREVYDYEP